MKNIFVFLLALGFGVSAFAEKVKAKEVVITLADKPTKKFFNVKFDPIQALLVGVYTGQVNYYLSNNISLGIRAKYTPERSVGGVDLNTDFLKLDEAGGYGFAFGSQVHYHLTGNQKSGAYLGVTANIAVFGGKRTRHPRTNIVPPKKAYNNLYSASAKLGYQWDLNSGFLLSSEVEPMFTYKNDEVKFSGQFTLLSVGLAV